MTEENKIRRHPKPNKQMDKLLYYTLSEINSIDLSRLTGSRHQ